MEFERERDRVLTLDDFYGILQESANNKTSNNHFKGLIQ